MAAFTALILRTPSRCSHSSSAFNALLGVDRNAVLPGGAAAEDAGVIGAGFGGHGERFGELRDCSRRRER